MSAPPPNFFGRTGRRAVVTGSSRGIGAAIAVALANDGRRGPFGRLFAIDYLAGPLDRQVNEGSTPHRSLKEK